jgi:hypothetical protein
MALHFERRRQTDRYFSMGCADIETKIGPKVFKMSQALGAVDPGGGEEGDRAVLP